MNVADLKLGSPDALGLHSVSHFYSRKPPEYAVYRADDGTKQGQRVLVHFADDPAKNDEQRKALAQLAPVRGEINGLIDGWRSAPDRSYFLKLFWITNGAKLRKRAEDYDRRVGDALTVALEGDLTGAGEVLRKIKDDITDQRVGRSRFEHLLVAFATAAVFILVAALINWAAGGKGCEEKASALCFDNATELWRGAMGGALGSFFSIVLAIRGRTILTDLNRISNLMDAVLRVTIGVIAGLVLVSLVLVGFVRIVIGDSSPNELSALYVAIIGFLAGFAERLVPDLLEKAEARTGQPPLLRRPEPDLADKAKDQGGAAGSAAGPAAAAAGAPAADPEPTQAHEDGCVADVALAPDEVTPDESLPAASGGVAKAAGGPAT